MEFGNGWAPKDASGVIRVLTNMARGRGSPYPEDAVSEVLLYVQKRDEAAESFAYHYGEASGIQPAPQWSMGRLWGWMVEALRRVVIDQHRREARRRKVMAEGATSSDDEPEIDRASNAPSPLDDLLRREQSEQYERCLSRLSEEERYAVLRFLDGASQAEIAAEMGRSKNNVASWVSRGREKLLNCMKRIWRPPGRAGNGNSHV